jgi:hypothetical protein
MDSNTDSKQVETEATPAETDDTLDATSDTPVETDEATAEPAATDSTAASRRADAYRERFRKAQVIASKVARARAAGGAPSDAEAARLVAEFQAGGGQVVVVPEVAPADQPEAERSRHAKRRTA